MKVKLKGKFKFILIGLAIAIILVAIAIILASAVVTIHKNYPDIRYHFASHLGVVDMISYNGNYYVFHGSEDDVDEVMYLLGDKIRVVLVDENGEPYKDGTSEIAYLYHNDPEVKYIYYGGGSWKKIDMVK